MDVCGIRQRKALIKVVHEMIEANEGQKKGEATKKSESQSYFWTLDERVEFIKLLH